MKDRIQFMIKDPNTHKEVDFFVLANEYLNKLNKYEERLTNAYDLIEKLENEVIKLKSKYRDIELLSIE